MILRPMYMNQLKPFVNTPFVKILTGVRRCGKSTILLMLIEELKKQGVLESQIIHFNFDSMKYDNIKDRKLLYKVISEKIKPNVKNYIFLDEVQEIENWERTVNSIMTDFDADIYVTGSNSKMLSSEISTYLTGRYVSINVYPLSFSEYLDFKKSYSNENSFNRKDDFAHYLKFGGFPAVNLRGFTQDEAYTIVKDIYNSTIFKDIVQRNKIRKIELLERVVKFVFDNVGKTFSAKSISDYLKNQNRNMDVETVYNYLSFLEKAFIIYRCSRYDLQGKEILKTQEKFFLADPAFKYSVLGYSPKSIAAMLENIVYLELKRRGYEVFVGKAALNQEIDFTAIKKNEKVYIQVCREISSEKTEKREYSNLLNIKDNYPKYLLRTDEFSEGNYEGIKTMHIADFLLLDEF